MKSKDIRVQKTNKSIEDAFLNLIKEKSFSEITIKDICSKAMISRLLSMLIIKINMIYWNTFLKK